MKILLLFLLAFVATSYGADDIIAVPGGNKAYFKDVNGNLMPMKIAYKTDGDGHLQLFNGDDPADDDILVPPGTGNMYLNGADGKTYPAMVLYTTDGEGNLIPIPAGGGSGSGDVVGPSSATDNAVVRYDTATGKKIQNSLVTIGDTGTLTAVQAILSGLTANTVPYLNGSKQFTSSAVTPTQLGYVDFTSSGQTQMDLKAPLASPAFTGNPTAVTQSSGDNSTRVATTAFVKAQSYITSAGAPVQSVNSQVGAVVLTKSDVGLSNVDNTSDASKPISTATQNALDLKTNISSLAAIATSGNSSDLTLNDSLIMPPNKCYYFQETGNDTGECSPTDGRIDTYSNGVVAMVINPDQDVSIPNGDLSVGQANIASVHTASGNASINVDDRRLIDSSATQVMNWEAKQLNGFWVTDDNFTVQKDFAINDGIFSDNYNAAPADDGGHTFAGFGLTLRPTIDSPSTSWNAGNLFMNIDPDSSGFDIGTGGNFGNILALGANHHGTSDIGSLNVVSSYEDIGNGVDPISVNGLATFIGQGTFHDGVTITGPLQGYGFQYNVNSGASFTQGVTAFYDYSNMLTDVGGYTEAAFTPIISGIKNNTNYNGINFNPNITTFNGNAGANVIALGGNYGTFGTGSFNGVLINPTVTSVNNAYGIFVDMTNVTVTGNKWAAYFNGNVQINGGLSFTGALATGQFNAFANAAPIDGGGNPQTINSAISSFTIPANDTTANADAIGFNTAMLLNVGANSNITLGGLGLLSSLALPMVIETHAGSYLSDIQGGSFALSYSGTSDGGTIGTAAAGRFVAIPNGITTTNRFYGVWSQQPFGVVGTDNWGIYSEDSEKNYFEGTIMQGAADSPSQSHFGIESSKTISAKEGFQMATSGSQPTCDAAHRGLQWNVEGGTGVPDLFQICQKDITDTYVWTTH